MLTATAEEQAAHFTHYIDRIKAFIIKFAPFSALYNNFYNYGLLVAKGDCLYLDDLGRYSTGGRTQTPINRDTIAYHITFNSIEVQFLKDVLAGKHDQRFLSQHPDLLDKVADTIRIHICNQLATEIITAKLISWLNARGNCQRVITLDTVDLNIFLKRSIQIKQDQIAEVIQESHEHYLIKMKQAFLTRGKASADKQTGDQYKPESYAGVVAPPADIDEELAKVWVTEGQIVAQFAAALAALQNESWCFWLTHWIFNTSHWDNPANKMTASSIMQHALRDTTLFGYRNRTFEACVALQWVKKSGNELEYAGEQNTLIKQAFEAATAPSAS